MPHPSLVVIGGGFAPPPRQAAADPLLANALPGDARRIFEVGPPDSPLGAAWGDRWLLRTPEQLGDVQPGFDLLVLSASIESLPDPLRLLRRLAALSAPDASLLLCADNVAGWASLERLVEADERHDGHRFSPATLYKLLLDAGWMPHLAAHDSTAAPRAALVAAADALADAQGMPRRTAHKTLSLKRLLVQSTRGFDALPGAGGAARFTVVVPTTREGQLRRNVEASPGLAEAGARIVSYRGARDPAEALERSLPHCETDWVLFAHQDVYFPRGFGARLNAVLDAVPANERARTLIGFAGMGVDRATEQIAQAGFVIDRLHRFDQPVSDAAVSIDELAIVVARDSIHRIDPALGWHLWATDLCLTSICEHRVLPRIVRLPLFHNSANDYVLPAAFHASAAVLARKHAAFGPIHTLCGVFNSAAAAAAG